MPNCSQYEVFAARMAADRDNGHHLIFERSQFDALIKQVRDESKFKGTMKAVQDGKAKGYELASLLIRSKLLHYKTRCGGLLILFHHWIHLFLCLIKL